MNEYDNAIQLAFDRNSSMRFVELFVIGLSVEIIQTRRATPLKPSEPPNVIAKNDTKPSDEIVFAHVIYRHGEREHNRHIELTNAGKRHLYDLGKYFRRRYGKILGNEYSSDKVYVLSTDHDRAIMSAQANLAGLYEPAESEIWNDKIFWSPVPVHTLPNELDIILRPRYGDRCPRYDELYHWYLKDSPMAQDMNKKYGHLFEYWGEKSDKSVDDIEDAFLVYKKFVDRKRENRTVPDWALDAIKPGSPLEQIANSVYALRAQPQLVRIRSGFLIQAMLEHFKAKIDGELDPDIVLFMYSAHSSTITTLLNGLGFNVSIPLHGFCFQFEMYKTPQNTYYLQVFFRQPDQEYPKAEEIQGCGTKCTLDEFYKVYKQLIPDKFEIECGVNENDESNQSDQSTDQQKVINAKNKINERNCSDSPAISVNACIFLIAMCNLWLFWKLFNKLYYKMRLSNGIKYSVFKV